MDHRERYDELLETIRILRNELDTLRLTKSNAPAETEREIFRKAFHSTSQLMAVSNLETGIYEDVNEAFLKSLGYDREDIIGKTSQEIQLFTDIIQSDKFIKILNKFKKVRDVDVTLRTKSGEEKRFVFSADTVILGSQPYLLTYYDAVENRLENIGKRERDNIIREVFDTISNYIALFLPVDNRFIISDFNFKAAEIEFIDKKELTGKYLDETPLSTRTKLTEILQHVNITREPYKLAVSPEGDDSRGYYTAFLLSSGEIVVTWEPGAAVRFKEKDYIKQGVVFERFANMLPMMVFELDLHGKVVYANKKGLDHFGYSEEDLERGVVISDVFKEDLKYVLGNLKKLTGPNQSTHNEYYAYKKNGERIPISTHTFASFEDGVLNGYRGVVIDISKQKNYEQQIQREKAFLEQFIDSTPEAIAISDLNGKVIRINREFTLLFGFTPEEAIGQNIDDLVVPDHLREESEIIDRLAATSRQEVRHTERHNKWGKTIHVNLIASTVTFNEETVATVGIYRDISAIRKTQLLQEVLYNLSTQALKMTNLADFYPVIVSEISKIWDTNNFFIALYNKGADTLSLPFFSDEKDTFDEIPAKKTITSWVIRNGKPVLLRNNEIRELEELGEVELVGTNSKVWLGVPLKEEDEIIGVMCLQDYNDEDKFTQEDLNGMEFIANQIAIAIQRKTTLENLEQARKSAEKAAMAKQQFMSTMSHEIRTPLNEVIGITNLLLQGNPREDQMDFLKTLRFSANHLLTLVNDVLDYNKMESGNLVFEKTQFNLHDFIDEIQRSYAFRAKDKNLEFIFSSDKNLPEEIVGDPIRLNQILSNLLSNSLKFTMKGHVKVLVKEVERKDNLSTIHFAISDTGIGIPSEMHEKIFESYSQASDDTTRKFGGTGLGLAICKKLIELMGSHIELESTPGEGSTFSFNITYELGDDFPGKVRGELSEKYDGLNGKNILVAEDNKINFFVANKFLQSWGVNVTHAENGLIALELLGRNSYDLVLMDLHMPVMDGVEASRIIRNSDNKDLKEIPIVALTAAIMSESQDKIKDIYINDYVLKPFKPRDLYEKILRHIK
ncbi:MAG: PAS domain S-box protein [Bacteroidales bacterium]|nr:PAS domain S-box protein [Bacteroidales bacterium]